GLDKNPVQEWDDPLLLLSTLDGSFYGVGQKTGYVRWKLKDGLCFYLIQKMVRYMYLEAQNEKLLKSYLSQYHSWLHHLPAEVVMEYSIQVTF
ncbi:hypothetical protein C0J52_08479, partial [Blattella germanica]